MKEHPDYKYRPRRKAKSMAKKDNRWEAWPSRVLLLLSFLEEYCGL